MKALQLNDFLNYQYLSALEFAPKGQHAVFAVSKADLEENKYRSNLWLYKKESGKISKLTAMDQEKSAVWLDDETVLFPSLRDEALKKATEKGEAWTVYYAININGGEAQEFMRIPASVGTLIPLGDDKFLLSAKQDNCGINLHNYEGAEKAAKEKELKHNKDYEVLTEIPYWSNGVGFTNGQRNRLYIYDKASETMTAITGEWDNARYCSNKDGKILYINHEFIGKQERTSGLYEYDLASGEISTLIPDDVYNIGMADYFGEEILCTASDMSHFGINENKSFYLVKDGKPELLAVHDFGFGSSIGSDCRLGGGRSYKVVNGALYFLSTEGSNSYLKKVSADGSIETLSKVNGSVDCIAVSSEEILYVAMRQQKLQELYRLEDESEIQLSSFNSDVHADTYVAVPEFVPFENDGWQLEGWVLKPKDFDPDKKYPAIIDIHGGPKTAYGDVYYHEMQLWANMGYFVFFCNPRGGDGRGNVFADIRGKYGTIDYDDLMKFTDVVLEQYPQIDAAKVGVTGGSYGGFMTNWIIGHTDRFAAAASQRSISNWISMFGTTDIGYYFADDQCASTPWVEHDKLWEQSPLKYADKAVTPTLFIHSEQDYRCWLTEGLQMFTALKYHGVEARLCMFRGENHELSRSGKPRHRVRRLEEITNWFESHLK